MAPRCALESGTCMDACLAHGCAIALSVVIGVWTPSVASVGADPRADFCADFSADFGSDLCVEAILQPPPRSTDVHLGSAVAFLRGRAAIGSARDQDTGVDDAAVHLFARLSGEWVSDGAIRHPRSDQHAAFGSALSGDSDRLLVGSPLDGADEWDGGRAFVYTAHVETIELEAELSSSFPQPNEHFGHSVALCGQWAVVGAPRADTWGIDAGRVDVFRRGSGGWTLHCSLRPADGAVSDRFGESVALNGDLLVVGAPGRDISPDSGKQPPIGGEGWNVGCAYVFRLSESGTELLTSLVSSQIEPGGSAGSSVACAHGLIAVGVPSDQVNLSWGSVRLWRRGANDSFKEFRMLVPHARRRDGGKDETPVSIYEFFGSCVALQTDGSDQGRIAVGAPGAEDQGESSGVVYIFEPEQGYTSAPSRISPVTAHAEDHIGAALSLADGRVIVGIGGNPEATPGAGMAYVLAPSPVRDAWDWSASLVMTPLQPGKESGVPSADSDWDHEPHTLIINERGVRSLGCSRAQTEPTDSGLCPRFSPGPAHPPARPWL